MASDPRMEPLMAAGKKPSKLAPLALVSGIMSLLCGLMTVLLLIFGQSTTPPMYDDSQLIVYYLMCFTAPLLVIGGGLFAGGLYAHRRAGKAEKQEVTSPGIAPAPGNTPAGTSCNVTLQVFYPGEFFLSDAKINAFLDGQPIGAGSAKHGLDITVKTMTGRHTLALHLGGIRKKEYAIELPSEAAYEAHLTYDRTWGNFANDLELRSRPVGEEAVRKLLQEHTKRLSGMFQGKPSEQEHLRFIQQVVAEDLLAFAAEQIWQKLPESHAENRAIHTTGECGEWFLAITLCPWLTPEEAKTNLGQGYMQLLDTLVKPALNMVGGRNIAHWIYCSNGSQAAVHLTLIPNPQGTYKGAVIVAQDFLTSEERQQVGLPSLPGQAASSFAKPTPRPVPGVCFQCYKPLKDMAGGAYFGAGMAAAMEQIPYPCKSCGTHFCVKCMGKIKIEHNNICPYCGQDVGW